MGKPNAILFDFGGTLDCPSHWLDRFLRHYRGAGIEIERDDLDAAFDFATKAGYAAGKPIQRFRLGDLIRFLVGNQFEYLRQSGPDGLRQWLEEKSARERFQLVERIRDSFLKETTAGLAHSREILTRLKPAFKLGVISNWYGNLDAIVAEAGMDRLLDVVIDSTRVGAFKPDPAIFHGAIKALRVQPRDAAMVGDSMLKDCAPAHQIGMRTVFLRAIGSDAVAAQVGNGFAPDYTINSLDELLELKW